MTISTWTAPSRTWRSPNAAASRSGEPAWRRLEQRLEQKRTAELISDFEDYDIGEPGTRRGPATNGAGTKSRR